MHPFYEQTGADAGIDAFWQPLRGAFTSVQRRQDVFMAGYNNVDGGKTLWVCSMGHFMGLFDHAWLGIPPTGKIAFCATQNFIGLQEIKLLRPLCFVILSA